MVTEDLVKYLAWMEMFHRNEPDISNNVDPSLPACTVPELGELIRRFDTVYVRFLLSRTDSDLSEYEGQKYLCPISYEDRRILYKLIAYHPARCLRCRVIMTNEAKGYIKLSSAGLRR